MGTRVCEELAAEAPQRSDTMRPVIGLRAEAAPMRPPAQAEGGPAFAGGCDAPVPVACPGQAIVEAGCKRRDALASECSIQGGRPHRRVQDQNPDWCRSVAGRSGDTIMRRSHEQQG